MLVLPINAQQDPEIARLKSFFAFNAWPGQNGPLKQGFSFNVPDYSSLSGFSISSDETDVSSLSLGLLRKLTLVSGSQILNLVIGVAIDSTNNAQELLLGSQIAGRQGDVEVELQRGDLNGITVGDLNFVYTRATTTSLGGAISFVRNNVMVAIWDGSPDNPSTVDLFALATAIDGKIKAQPNLNLSQFNGEKPVINLTPASTSLTAVEGASTTVAISVTDPTNNSGPISRQFLTGGNLTVQDNGTTLAVSPNSTLGANGLQVIANNSFLQFSTATVTFTVTEAVSGPAWWIGLAHNGIFSQGQTNAIYMIYATNVGASATTGLATLTEMLPTGLTLVSMSGSGWICAANTCTRSDALASGVSYPPVTVTVNVAATAPASLTNQAMISGGSVSQSATDLDLTTIDSPEPVFTIQKTHTGNFVFGQMNATYTITVSNMGAVASSGTVSVTDTPPTGLTLTSMSGSGWSCTLPTCTRSDSLNPGAPYATIAATVNVAANAPAQVTNAATVSGAGSPTVGATDVTTIAATNQPATVQVTVTTNVNGPLISVDGGAAFTGSQTFNWTIGSTNHSLATTTPQTNGGTQYVWLNWSDGLGISHTVTAPSTAITYTANFKTQYLLTTQVSPSAAAGSISPATGFFDAGSMVSVGATANNGYGFTGFTGALSGSTNPQTITTNAPATVTANFQALPDLTIMKTHAGGHFSQGQMNATYKITVGNNGPGASSGTVTVTDTIPTGLMLVSMVGTGWTCGPPNANNVCTRTDPIGSGGTYQPITVTVNVDPAARASVTNQATVSGNGDYNLSNNMAADQTTINPITNVSNQVLVTQNGFGRNRSTGLWSATMTVKNTGMTTLNGPIQVVLTSLTPGVTMANNPGVRNGYPYITVMGAGTLLPGASVNVTIEFSNPSNGFIGFTPVTDLGVF